jgi:hypothetical protein
MNGVDQATETQLRNIQAKTGRSLDELSALVAASGLTKHGEVRAMLQQELGLGYGDANTLTHVLRQPAADPAAASSADDVLDGIYTGPKAALRPIHDRLMADIEAFGPFEVAPKKGYVSLRRKKQFAMIGPATNSRVEVGLNARDLAAADRLTAVPPGGMCQYKVRLGEPDEVDAELVGWLRQAYDAAG